MAATNIITLDFGKNFLDQVGNIQSYFYKHGQLLRNIILNPLEKCNITLAAVIDPRPVSERKLSSISVQSAIDEAFRSVAQSRVHFGDIHREKNLIQMKVLNAEYVFEIRQKILDILKTYEITPVDGHCSAKLIIARSERRQTDDEHLLNIELCFSRLNFSLSDVPIRVTWKILKKSPLELKSHLISLPFSVNERVIEIQKTISSFNPMSTEYDTDIVLGVFYVKEGEQFPEEIVKKIINEVVPKGFEVTLEKFSLFAGKVILDLCPGSAQKIINLQNELFQRLNDIGVMPVNKCLRLKIPILGKTSVDEGTVAAVVGANYWRRLTKPIVLTSPGAILMMTRKTHYVSSELSEESKEGIAKAVGPGVKMVNCLHFTWGVYGFKDDITTEDAVNQELKDFFNNNVKGLVFRFGEFQGFENSSSLPYISVTDKGTLQSIREKLNKFLKERGIFCTDRRFTPHVTISRERSLCLPSLGGVENIPPSPVHALLIKKLGT